jgi:Uma2 family endonuclease
MVASKEHSPRFTLDEYFAWEQQQEVKHEYFDGEVFAMSGGTVNHGRIGGRIFSLIDDRLSESDRCIALNSDVKIKIQASEKADAHGAWKRTKHTFTPMPVRPVMNEIDKRLNLSAIPL